MEGPDLFAKQRLFYLRDGYKKSNFYAHAEHAANQDTIREFVGRDVGAVIVWFCRVTCTTGIVWFCRVTCTLSVRVVVVSDLTHHINSFGYDRTTNLHTLCREMSSDSFFCSENIVIQPE